MKNKIIITILFFFLFSNAFSQTWHLGVGTGVWIHSQKSLKDFNESIQSSLPFSAEITDNFPITPYFQLNAGYTFKKLSVGTLYTFNSTGSRITSTDYSGSYYFDLILSGHLAGLTVGSFKSFNNKWLIIYNAEIGSVFSSLKMKESVIINNFDSYDDETDFAAISIYSKPNVQLSYELKKLSLGLSVGYLIDFKSQFRLKNQKDAVLINPSSHTKVKSGWNGFMIGFSLSLLHK